MFVNGDESDRLAWTKNPLLNIEKAVELKKLRRDVPLKIVVDGLSRDELSLFTLYEVEGLTPERIVEKTANDVESVRYQLLKIEHKILYRTRIGSTHPPVPKIMKQQITNNLTCSSPVLGKWVNDCDFPFIMETLLLSDQVFKQEFQGIHLSEDERKLFARELDAHSKACARCRTKRAEDEAWKERTGKALAKRGQVMVRESRRP